MIVKKISEIKNIVRPLYHRIYLGKNLKHYKRSYSQQGEDMIIAVALEDKLYNKTPGFYIDIGAFHPQKYSSTYYLVNSKIVSFLEHQG